MSSQLWDRTILCFYAHPSPGQGCFYVFMRVPPRDGTVFMFLCASLPGTGLFLCFYARPSPGRDCFYVSGLSAELLEAHKRAHSSCMNSFFTTGNIN